MQPSTDKFNYQLNQRVALKESDEVGEILGRAEYAHSENTYYLRYKDASGKLVQDWWAESAISGPEV